MTWVNFREIQDRFTPIDAQFVAGNARFDEGTHEVTVTLRFYPWWEHPLYVAARAAGEPRGFRDTNRGARDVTVRAIRPVGVHLTRTQEISEWAFSTEHPVLWDFCQHSVIYVNGAFDVRTLIDRLVARNMPFVQKHEIVRYLDPTWLPVPSRGVSLPTQLQRPVIEELGNMGLRTFVPEPPPSEPTLVAFLLDDRAYVVAEDFEVDVPDFTHDPAWFDPGTKGTG